MAPSTIFYRLGQADIRQQMRVESSSPNNRVFILPRKDSEALDGLNDSGDSIIPREDGEASQTGVDGDGNILLSLRTDMPPPSETKLLSETSRLYYTTLQGEPLQSSVKRKHIPQIVGGTIGGVAFFALLFLLFFLYRRKNQKSTPIAGPLQVSRPMTKEAFTSPKCGHYGFSFSTSSLPPSSTDTLPTGPSVHKSFRSKIGLGPVA